MKPGFRGGSFRPADREGWKLTPPAAVTVTLSSAGRTRRGSPKTRETWTRLGGGDEFDEFMAGPKGGREAVGARPVHGLTAGPGLGPSEAPSSSPPPGS